ncbi:MAG TPA: hypothetical protein VK509_07665 [Polyangiales bacterium]|nr:hypothetical protein [Polyangiales bacterium]
MTARPFSCQRRARLGWLLACLAACLSACTEGGSETGNPVVTQMELGLRSEDPEKIGVRSGSGGAVLEQAWLAFGELTLLRGDECAQLGEIDVFGPTAVAADLARGNTQITLEPATRSYCGLVLPLNQRSARADLPADAPAELAEHSIVLRGQRADGVRFELLHSEQDALELAGDGGDFAVGPQGPALLLSFDVAVWMDGVELDGAQIGDDGIIHIDVDSAANRPLLDAYEANLECSLELYADDDDDGQVGASDTRLAHCFDD